MRTAPFFYRETSGIRVTVRPAYLRDHSRPAHGHFVFAYAVRLENVGSRACTLLTRRWLIHDAAGEDTEVAGDGVIGVQPTLAPGGVHEYESYCVLKSPNGYMEGDYGFMADGGDRFEVRIPRFTLDAAGTSRPPG